MSNDRYERIRKALAMGPTPGPWSVRYDYVVQAPAYDDGRLVPVAQPYGVNCDGTDLFANAALIAACDPDTIRALLAERDALLAERDALREALKDAEVKQGELLAALEGMEKWASSIYDGYPPSTASIAAAPYREAARAAIAALRERYAPKAAGDGASSSHVALFPVVLTRKATFLNRTYGNNVLQQ